MRKPTLAVIVGAGASVRAGAPSTEDLTEAVKAALSEGVFQYPNVVGPPAPFKKPFLEAVERIAKARRHAMNFEDIAGAIEELLAVNTTVGPFLKDDSLRVFDALTLAIAQKAIVNATIDCFIARLTPAKRSSAQSIKTLLRKLSSEYRIVQITLNYDSLLDDVLTWVDGFRLEPGKNYSVFDPILWKSQITARKSHILMHLHSSLKFGYRGGRLEASIPFAEPVKYEFDELAAETTLNSAVSDPLADGQFFAAMPIVAGRDKVSKIFLNVRPFAFYSAAGLSEVSFADALLVVGYGFGDEHINGWIDQFLRIRPLQRAALVTRRTGEDIGENTAIEQRIVELATDRFRKHRIYVTSGGTAPLATRYDFGRFYLEASGVPLDSRALSDILAFLSNNVVIRFWSWLKIRCRRKIPLA